MKPTLLILAAGMGSRYGGLKQVDALGPSGEAIIEFSVYDAIRAGFGKVVFVIRDTIEAAFKEKFAGKFEDKIQVEYVFQDVNTEIEGVTDLPERVKPWGTAHAVLVAENVINEPFAVINADDYYGVEAFQTIAKFLTEDVSADNWAMVGYILKNTLSDHGTVNRGVCTADAKDHLTNVVERHKIGRKEDNKVYFVDDDGSTQEVSENAVVSMNFWGFHQDIFSIIKSQFIEFAAANRENPKAEFYIPLVVNRQIEADEAKLKVLTSDDNWYGVTYQDDKPMVQSAFDELVEKGVYPNSLW
jgi:UTP-glucose-1-phosphate uridylyltransferase